MAAIEIVHIQPKPDMIDRLLALRPTIIGDYKKRDPGVQAQLFLLEDGSMIDIWSWSSREIAEEALADQTISAAFGEWVTLVELLSLKWADAISPG